MMKKVEAVFCILYLLFAFIAGIIFLIRRSYLAAAMTFLLAGGDAFHLFPRIRISLKGEGPDDRYQLGLGNFISSITMTFFYVFLYLLLRSLHSEVKVPAFIFPLIVFLAIVRCFLCFFPQNDWFKKQNTKNNWHIYRNIPFIGIGILTVFYLSVYYKEYLMAILVCFSFLFYIGTVLFAGKNPKMGMLMIPKTICYVWLIALFL